MRKINALLSYEKKKKIMMSFVQTMIIMETKDG